MSDKPTPQEIVGMQLNAVNAVCSLAEHLNRDPLALAKELADGGLVELVKSLDETLGLIRKAQERLCEYLVPDGSNDEHEVMNDLLYMLDGPEQRAIETPARAILTGLRSAGNTDHD